MATGRGSGFAAGGTSLLAFAAGGWAPGRSAATEEWTQPQAQQNQTITVS